MMHSRRSIAGGVELHAAHLAALPEDPFPRTVGVSSVTAQQVLSARLLYLCTAQQYAINKHRPLQLLCAGATMQ